MSLVRTQSPRPCQKAPSVFRWSLWCLKRRYVGRQRRAGGALPFFYSMTCRRSSRGSSPSAVATAMNSTTSSLRSPLSYFETYDCGVPSTAATSTCVSPFLFRALMRISQNHIYRLVKVDFTGVLLTSTLWEIIKYPKRGFFTPSGRNNTSKFYLRSRLCLLRALSAIWSIAIVQF